MKRHHLIDKRYAVVCNRCNMKFVIIKKKKKIEPPMCPYCKKIIEYIYYDNKIDRTIAKIQE